MGTHDGLSSEHHLRRRAEQVRADLEAVWGDDLPPGQDPVATVLTDAVAHDDANGRRSGVLVQGDAVPVSLLARLLTTSPEGRELVEQLPPAVRARLDLTRATSAVPEGPDAARWPPDPTAQRVPTGAFAVRALEGVVDIDERVSSLLGYPARQHRLSADDTVEAVHPDDRCTLQEQVARTIEKRTGLNVRFRVVHPDGHVRWLSSVGHALTGADGVTELVVGFTTPSP